MTVFVKKPIRELCTVRREHVVPQANVEYTLYSLPAFDNSQKPELVDGKDIKSSKLAVESNIILFNKLNVKFRRVWNVHEMNDENAVCSTEFIPLKANQSILQDYLYYNLISDALTNTMDAARKGTSCSQQRIDVDALFSYEISVPPIAVQEKIVGILLNIDRKIKQNEAINHNLQQQAQAIFEEWFTSHTTGFKEISLASLMSYAGGSQPPASEFVSNPRKGYVRFVQIRDYDSDGHITYIPISKKNKLCEETDIMIARYGASLGRICYGLNGAYNVALAKVFPKKSYYREFLRCYLSSRDFYEGINYRGGRSAQAGFNESDIRSFTLAFPYDEAIVQKFEDIAYPMFAQRLSLMKESRKLGNLRNSLLPKLLSGEINTLEIEF